MNGETGAITPFSYLHRLTADGQSDTAFGTNGRIVANNLNPGNAYELPFSMLVKNNGQLALGEMTQEAVRTFGESGAFSGTAEFSGNRASVRSMVETPDGGLLMIGLHEVYDANSRYSLSVSVARLGPDGLPDVSFGTNGRAVIPIPESEYSPAAFYSVVPLGTTGDGRYTIAVSGQRIGRPWEGVEAGPVVTRIHRLTADGRLDSTFSDDGTVEFSTPQDSLLTTGQLQVDGSILLLAKDFAGAGLLARSLNADGTNDLQFGEGGWLHVQTPELQPFFLGTQINSYGSVDRQTSVALPDGRIAMLGTNRDYKVLILVLDPNAETPDDVGNGPIDGPVGGEQPPIPVVTLPVEGAQLPPVLQPVEQVSTERELPVFTPVDASALAPLTFANNAFPQLPATYIPPFYSVSGDFNGDGVADTIVTDGPLVSILSGKDGSVLLKPFAPFEASYTGGLNAVAIDVDAYGDGFSELAVAPTAGGGAIVAVFNADGSQRNRFFGLDDPDFRGGLGLAVGDVRGSYSGQDLVVTAGAGGGPRVAVYDGSTLGSDVKKVMPDFFAFEAEQRAGVTALFRERVLVFGAGPGGAPRIRGIDATFLTTATRSGSLKPINIPQVSEFDRFVGDVNLRNGVKFDVENGKNMVYAADGTFFGVRVDDGDGEPTSLMGKWGRFYVPGIDPVPEYTPSVVINFVD